MNDRVTRARSWDFVTATNLDAPMTLLVRSDAELTAMAERVAEPVDSLTLAQRPLVVRLVHRNDALGAKTLANDAHGRARDPLMQDIVR